MGPVADGRGEEAEENLSAFKTTGYIFDSFAKQPCIGRAPVRVAAGSLEMGYWVKSWEGYHG